MTARLSLLLALLLLAACGSDDDARSSEGPPSSSDPGPSSVPAQETSSPSSEDSSTTPVDEIPLLTDARITSRPDDPNFHRVRAPLDLAGGPFADARLRIELGTTCYPFTGWNELHFPPGHNWPESCDAFDRNFEILLRQIDAPEDQPLFEVERAITPFGGPMTLDVDITDLANARPGDWELIVHISTWSDRDGQVTGADGGWNIDAFATLVPGEAPRPVLDAIPLFNGNLTHEEPLLEAEWTVDDAVESARLELRTTGHGGASDPSRDCIGPAEEFCRRFHSLRIDGATLTIRQPWRDDCDTLCTLRDFPFGAGDQQYCAENPCGALGSVRAPRANWCPGDVSPPLVLDDARLHAPGTRTFTMEVEDIFPGGSWRTSAVLYTYGTRP
ncbi:MAG: hypothetical protein EA398_05040 [Deltaproteobacteria bacterium]|nr:MAG: hypothetical protein EA398_05040 [Deltaproteobacteria bacterium]